MHVCLQALVSEWWPQRAHRSKRSKQANTKRKGSQGQASGSDKKWEDFEADDYLSLSGSSEETAESSEVDSSDSEPAESVDERSNHSPDSSSEEDEDNADEDAPESHDLDELQVQIEMRNASPADIPPVKRDRDLFIRNLCAERKYQECADVISSLAGPGRVFAKYPFTNRMPWAEWSSGDVYPDVEDFMAYIALLNRIKLQKPAQGLGDNGALEQILLSIGLVWRHLDSIQFVNSPSDEQVGAASLGYTNLPFQAVVAVLENGLDLLYKLVIAQRDLCRSLNQGALSRCY